MVNNLLGGIAFCISNLADLHKYFKQMKTQSKVILKMFKEANPQLVVLSPKIFVDEILESSSSDSTEIIVHDPPVLQITVKHPFVFDNRLVPTEFQGIKVLNVTTGKFPSEFPESLTDILLVEYYNPERYFSFVKRSLSRIKKKLKRPDLSEEEALDALTGNFNKHVDWCNNLSKER